MVPSITTVGNDHDSLHLVPMSFRSPRPGPEALLVQQFLSRVRLRAFPDCRITVFKEPNLDGSYPDIVLVAWRPSVTRTWRPERKGINASDLRLLQHLVASSRQTDADLVRLFGTGYKATNRDMHSGGVWKMFDKAGNRLGTFDGNLVRIGN